MPRARSSLASLVRVSKLRCDNRRCHNQLLVFDAFDRRQIGDVVRQVVAATVGVHITRVTYSVRPILRVVPSLWVTGPSRQVFASLPLQQDMVIHSHRQVKGLSQKILDRANTGTLELKRLQCDGKYLADLTVFQEAKLRAQHALRKNVCTLEVQVRELCEWAGPRRRK
ncbi:hypothetical protein Tco_1216557 [Tanacetum coccineum]